MNFCSSPLSFVHKVCKTIYIFEQRFKYLLISDLVLTKGETSGCEDRSGSARLVQNGNNIFIVYVFK